MNKILLCYLLVWANTSYSMATNPINWEKAIDQAVSRHGLPTEPQLVRYFQKADVAYPPKQIALLAFKKEQTLQLWAKDTRKTWRHIHTYPLTAYSGYLGPKLRERDLQIPEGIYKLTSFNPFSNMHATFFLIFRNQ